MVLTLKIFYQGLIPDRIHNCVGWETAKIRLQSFNCVYIYCLPQVWQTPRLRLLLPHPPAPRGGGGGPTGWWGAEPHSPTPGLECPSPPSCSGEVTHAPAGHNTTLAEKTVTIRACHTHVGRATSLYIVIRRVFFFTGGIEYAAAQFLLLLLRTAQGLNNK